MSTEVLNTILERLDNIESLLQNRDDKSINKEEFVDTQEICEKFKITKEAVKKYRQRNIIPYYKMNGKILFKMSEVLTQLSIQHNGSNRR